MANINFVLREPFKKGTREKVKELRKRGGRVDNLYNQDETPILLHFGHDRKHRFKCKTDFKIKPREWDFKKQRKKTNLPGSYELNERIDILSQDLTDYYNRLISKTTDITFNTIKEKITAVVKKNQNPDFEEGTGFFDVIEKYINGNKTKVSPRTIPKYNTLKKSLENFSIAKEIPKFNFFSNRPKLL